MKRILGFLVLLSGCGGAGETSYEVRVNEIEEIYVSAPSGWTCDADRGGCIAGSSTATYHAPSTPGMDLVTIYSNGMEWESFSVKVIE